VIQKLKRRRREREKKQGWVHSRFRRESDVMNDLARRCRVEYVFAFLIQVDRGRGGYVDRHVRDCPRVF